MKNDTATNIVAVRDFLAAQPHGAAVLPDVLTATGLKANTVNGLSGAWTGPASKTVPVWRTEKKGEFTVLVITDAGRTWTPPEKKVAAAQTTKAKITTPEEAIAAVLGADVNADA